MGKEERRKEPAADLMKQLAEQYKAKTGNKIKDIAAILNSCGITQSTKTIYAWCSGTKPPPAEALLLLGCLVDYPDLYEMAGLRPREAADNKEAGCLTAAALYEAFINHPEMQSAVSYLLGLTETEETECENKPSDNFCDATAKADT